MGATIGWTGYGAIPAYLLLVDGAATISQGFGMIVNDISGTTLMGEENIVRGTVEDAGETLGGKTGGQIATAMYDAAVMASNVYATMSAIRSSTPVRKSSVNDPVKDALNKLESSGLRPGQTQISRSRVMTLVDDYNPIKAQSSIYSKGGVKYIVEGHHTTVASTILGKGTSANMGIPTSQMPSATNVYWVKNGMNLERRLLKLLIR